MDAIEIEGVEYYKKEEASDIIEKYKTDMLKYKEEKNTLKAQNKELSEKAESLELDIRTGAEKLKAVGASEEDLKNSKVELADWKAKVERLEGELSKREEAISNVNSQLFKEKVVNKLRAEMNGKIHPNSLEDAVQLASQKAKLTDEGEILMDGGFSPSEYVAKFAEERPHWALDQSAQKGAGMEDQEGGTSKGGWKDMSQSERIELLNSNPEKAEKMQKAHLETFLVKTE